MFFHNRFTERAQSALTCAQEAAASFGHSYIGSEHLLLGLLREGGGPAAKALTAAGVTAEALEQQIEALSGRGTPDSTAPQGMTPRTKRIIELSIQSASQTGTNYVGTDHLLLGILREGQNVALTALANLGITPQQLVEKLTEALGGMQSDAFDTFISDLSDTQGVSLKECFEHSFCLSSDVTACYDPNYAGVYDPRNSSYINQGVSLCKYTGSRGKGGCNDASAEVMGYVRRIFEENGVLWSVAELGKVDAGGGGTVALYMSNRNIDTVDAGTPVLGMHAPFEVTGKLDCYMTYKGCKAVYEA